MKHPKVGECIYAISFGCDSVGETQFLCSTQEHATKTLKDILEEADEIIEENFNVEPIEDDPVEYKKQLEQLREEHKEEMGETIIYAMVRIA